MPTITFRITEEEHAAIRAAASLAGTSVSDYIRDALRLVDDNADIFATVEDHAARLARLETLAFPFAD